MDWYPESGETPLFRGRATFATGNALKVAGMRWFRDDQGRDIGAELPDWPSAPEYVKRDDKAAKGGGKAFGVFGKVTAAVGRHPKSADPALEVEDFPVMWAASGTIARAVPWQLDPDRRLKGYYTDVQLTDRRLLVLASARMDRPADVLWQIPLDQVAGAQHHSYSYRDGDVTIRFVDDSWVRLDFYGLGRAAKATWVLSGNTEPVELNASQKAKMDVFTRSYEEGAVEAVATPVPEAAPGTVLVELVVTEKSGFVQSLADLILDPEGKSVRSRQ